MARIPTTVVWKGGEPMVVNASDAADWIAQGWTTEAPDDVDTASLFAEAPKPRQRRGTTKTGDAPATEAPAADE